MLTVQFQVLNEKFIYFVNRCSVFILDDKIWVWMKNPNNCAPLFLASVSQIKISLFKYFGKYEDKGLKQDIKSYRRLNSYTIYAVLQMEEICMSTLVFFPLLIKKMEIYVICILEAMEWLFEIKIKWCVILHYKCKNILAKALAWLFPFKNKCITMWLGNKKGWHV